MIWTRGREARLFIEGLFGTSIITNGWEKHCVLPARAKDRHALFEPEPAVMNLLLVISFRDGPSQAAGS